MRKRIAALVMAAMAITTIAFAGSADAATAPTMTIATTANKNVIHPDTGHGQGIHAGGHLLTAPPAPLGAHSRSLRPSCCTYPGISPWVSPSVDTQWIPPGSTYICNYGDLCTLVWDPTTEQWKLFHLYDCHYYSLYYWNGEGYFYDNQTGNPTSYFYNSNGNVITSFTENQAGRAQYPENWGPVDAIVNC